MDYKINAYHFKAKGDIGLCVLARTKETAMKMIDTFNKRFPNKAPYKPKLFGLKLK